MKSAPPAASLFTPAQLQALRPRSNWRGLALVAHAWGVMGGSLWLAACYPTPVVWLLAGVVIGSQEKLQPVRNLRGIMGGVNSPHNAYLLERGLKTLALRMERHNANGLAVARFLERHPRVERVLYPGLESHPYHALATRTMRGFGGLVTFFVKDSDWRQTAKVIDAVCIPRIGPSLGGVESLIEQPLVMSYWNYSPTERASFRIADNMIRLACGIEDSADLIADLGQALDSLDR